MIRNWQLWIEEEVVEEEGQILRGETCRLRTSAEEIQRRRSSRLLQIQTEICRQNLEMLNRVQCKCTVCKCKICWCFFHFQGSLENGTKLVQCSLLNIILSMSFFLNGIFYARGYFCYDIFHARRFFSLSQYVSPD